MILPQVCQGACVAGLCHLADQVERQTHASCPVAFASARATSPTCVAAASTSSTVRVLAGHQPRCHGTMPPHHAAPPTPLARQHGAWSPAQTLLDMKPAHHRRHTERTAFCSLCVISAFSSILPATNGLARPSWPCCGAAGSYRCPPSVTLQHHTISHSPSVPAKTRQRTQQLPASVAVTAGGWQPKMLGQAA